MNERTYRQLHPRVIDAQPARGRAFASLVIGGAIVAMFAVWMFAFLFLVGWH